MNLFELAKEAGLEPRLVSSTQGGEFHSACPSCGGKDRFFIQPYRKMKNCSGGYCCRQCGIKGDTIQFGRDFCGLSFSEAAERANATILQKTPATYLYKLPKTNSHCSLEQPPNTWIISATAFVEQAYQQILGQPEILDYLEKRGLPIDAIKKYKIGWNQKELWIDKKNWGITDNNKCLWLPMGIVIPFIEANGNVLRLKIRRTNWHANDIYPKYVALPGSMNGLWVLGNIRHSTMIVVESELDAYAIHYATHDFASAVAVGSNIKNPDNVTDYLAKRTSTLLICHDNDDNNAGINMLNKWQLLYPHAQAYPTPIGKDIGEAIEKGLQIRSWILLHRWANSSDLELMRWALNFLNQIPETKKCVHFKLEQEIALGPDSPRAKTGDLRQALKLLKQMSDIPSDR